MTGEFSLTFGDLWCNLRTCLTLHIKWKEKFAASQSYLLIWLTEKEILPTHASEYVASHLFLFLSSRAVMLNDFLNTNRISLSS